MNLLQRIHAFLLRDHALMVRYLVSGVVGIAANALTFYIFNELFGLWYLFAVVPAFIVGLVVPFLLQKYWTFKMRGGSWHFQLGNYLFISVVNLGINALLVYLLVSVAGLWPTAGQFISLGVIAVTGFLFNYLVTFHER